MLGILLCLPIPLTNYPFGLILLAYSFALIERDGALMPHFCVSIALVENGEPIAGVVFDPLRNELFTASKGGGAVLNDKKIRVADRKDLAGALLVTGFPPRERARLAPQLEAIRQLLDTAEDVRRTGSAALDLAYVACGRADGYFEAGIKPWDIAAGMLLVREAGGRVSDFRGRGEKILDAGQIVAGNQKVCPALQKAIVQAGYASARCGRLIRKAWVTGVAV